MNHIKTLDQLAAEGRAAWRMMLEAMTKKDRQAAFKWNKEWNNINTRIRNREYSA